MRQAVLVLTLITAGCAPTPPAVEAQGDPLVARESLLLETADIATLAARIRDGTLTSRELTQAYLDRIERLDRTGPQLNSVLALNPEALRDAERLDAEIAEGRGVRGPLHGIPILLKDNIDAVPMATTAGSLALASHRPARDAFLVQLLRAAGAVILGKTNLSEWANFRSTNSISGWSGMAGQTRNPHVLDRNPCGSSSGSGVAAAAALAAATVGTETDGSIICPAAVSGVVGLKPTVGLVSRSGIVPISPSQDTAGPMARSVADAALLLDAMVGADPADPHASTTIGRTSGLFSDALRADTLRGARIGLLRKSMGFHPEVDAHMERAVAALRSAGAEVVDVEIAGAGKWNAPEFTVLLAEFRPALEAYLMASGAPVRTLPELIAFNSANASDEMPYFAQELFDQAMKAPALTSKTYTEAKARARRLAGPDGIDAVIRTHRLDALLAPATSPAWRIDSVLGDHFVGAGYGAAAVAGYPSITVPMGDVRGLPVGLVFMGGAWSERRLIELAYGFEQATGARKVPRFVPTIDILPPRTR